jgi:hypothetical protein
MMASVKNISARLISPIFTVGQFQGGERSLVNPGQFQRLQPEGDRLAPQPQRRLQVRVRSWLQVFSQRRYIEL